MRVSCIAGLVYFALVFAAGFALGVIRTLVILPRAGELAAVLIELPVILAVSWIACGWTVRRFKLPANFSARFLMGVVAFALLMGAELALSTFLLGRSAPEFLAALQTPPGAIGLAGQVVFALMPMARR